MSNLFIGEGNLGSAPELKTVEFNNETHRVLELRVFFDAYKQDAEKKYVQDEEKSFWRSVTLWDARAERAAKLLVKGARVLVKGSEKGETWTDKASGEVKKDTRIVADDVYLSFARVESVTFKPKSESSDPDPEASA
jgi:single-strand DNA-binding protein